MVTLWNVLLVEYSIQNSLDFDFFWFCLKFSLSLNFINFHSEKPRSYYLVTLVSIHSYGYCSCYIPDGNTWHDGYIVCLSNYTLVKSCRSFFHEYSTASIVRDMKITQRLHSRVKKKMFLWYILLVLENTLRFSNYAEQTFSSHKWHHPADIIFYY